MTLIKELEGLPSYEVNISGAHYISRKKVIELVKKHKVTGEQLHKMFMRLDSDHLDGLEVCNLVADEINGG